MKPIEPGCLAIVITGNAEFVGMTVHVIEQASDDCHTMPNGVTTCGGHNEWVIETPRPVPVKIANGSTKMVTMGSTSERYLLRIDGGEDESVTTGQDQEVGA